MTGIKATLKDHMGSDLSVVNAARVSFGKKSEGLLAWKQVTEDMTSPIRVPTRQDESLIRYLAKHKHLSPFGHAFASFHVKAPVFVARQLVKHKFLRWNEISRRYVDDKPEFYMPDVWRGRSDDKKQGSSDEVVNMLHWIVEDPELSIEGHTHYDNVSDNPDRWSSHVNTQALDLYNAMLNSGVAPEQARMVLPQSTMTEWWWSGSLDAFAAMCVLRCASDTQYETRIVAEQINKVMGDLFPISWAALMENTHE